MHARQPFGNTRDIQCAYPYSRAHTLAVDFQNCDATRELAIATLLVPAAPSLPLLSSPLRAMATRRSKRSHHEDDASDAMSVTDGHPVKPAAAAAAAADRYRALLKLACFSQKFSIARARFMIS